MMAVIHVKTLSAPQDYENRIQCLQEQVERHSMISSVATTHMFDEEEEEEGKNYFLCFGMKGKKVAGMQLAIESERALLSSISENLKTRSLFHLLKRGGR